MEDHTINASAECEMPEALRKNVRPASMDADPIDVLIIEDEEAHFQLMKRAIHKELPETSVCHMLNAADCLEELDRLHPDVILVDYLMPGMTGLEFLSAVQQMGSDIPVIMITGQGDESIAVRAMKLGAQDYLVKNADFFLLLPAVIAQVARERRLKLHLRKVARLNELLLDSLPYPAMMIRRDRVVLAANHISQQMGVRVGEHCWRGYILDQIAHRPHDDRRCLCCRSDDSFRLNQAINSPELAADGRVWDVWWIPIDHEVCLHYAIDITVRKRAEMDLRISSGFLEVANRHTDMPALLQGFVREIKRVTGCRAVAVRVIDEERGAPFVAGEGCDPQLLAAAASARRDVREPEVEYAREGGPARIVAAGRTVGSVGDEFDAIVSIPLRLGERPLGAIHLADPGQSMPADIGDILNTAAMKLMSAVVRILSQRKLEKSEETLRLLSNRLISTQEEERTRIARELHDSIGSSLCAIRLSAENMLQGEADVDSIERIVSMARSTMDEVRRIMTDLRPSILDDIGIVAALRWLCRQFKGLHPGITVEQRLDIDEDDIPEPLKIVIFRIVQEAFNNVAKYSRAAAVALGLTKKEQAIHLAVTDDGVGFDPEAAALRRDPGSGIGLTSMKERAEISGGAFSLRSREGAGTTVAASWPIQN